MKHEFKRYRLQSTMQSLSPAGKGRNKKEKKKQEVAAGEPR